MDPFNLLKELFGEEPIRKILSSGFDSVGKIAAATPESLSFFAGIQESLARQIVQSAEELQSGAVEKAGIREALAGTATAPTQPRELSRAAPKKETAKPKPPRAELLDERPLVDGGALLKSLARERPKELLLDEDFLEEIGLSGAEAGLLEGISSPWPSDSPAKERISPVPIELLPDPPPSRGNEVEFASVSDWSPDEDPDPVPRMVRAPELGTAPEEKESGSEAARFAKAAAPTLEPAASSVAPIGAFVPETKASPAEKDSRAEAPTLATIRVLTLKAPASVKLHSEKSESLPKDTHTGAPTRSFWKFGR